MTMALEGQVEAQKESQHIVHPDQEAFMIKLHTMRSKLENILVTYEKRQYSLWDFAQLTLPFHHGLATFSDSDKKGGLTKLM